MNQDTVYEILKELYLIGDAASAKKIILSLKKFCGLEHNKIEKPIVLKVFCKSIELKIRSYNTAVVYWGDGKFTQMKIDSDYPTYQYTNKRKKNHIIRIFGHCEFLLATEEIKEIISIGELTDLSRMFGFFTKNPPIGKKWDTSRVTSMLEMFIGCKKLNKNVGKYWDTSGVTDMSGMFYCCEELNQPIGKYWNTSKVINMSWMFYGCEELNQPIGKYWNTSKVINMSWMFYCCKKLEELKVKNWDTSQVTNMHCIFAYCDKLSKINYHKWILNKKLDTEFMFYQSGIEKLNISVFS